MDPTPERKLSNAGGQYDANYGNFQTELYEQIHREAFGEGHRPKQLAYADGQDSFLGCLNLSAGKTLLDVGCGAAAHHLSDRPRIIADWVRKLTPSLQIP